MILPQAVTLAAIGWIAAAAAMAATWASRRTITDVRTIDAVPVSLVAGLAVFYAARTDGMIGRRLAIASMMASWGGRLAVHLLYERAMLPGIAAVDPMQPSSTAFWRAQMQAAGAVFYSLPALLSSMNRTADFSILELAAAGLWIAGFTGESAADRQRLRFARDPANAGRRCDAGVWRHLKRPDLVLEAVVWIAFALFTFASPSGWISLACPVVRVYQLRHTSCSST